MEDYLLVPQPKHMVWVLKRTVSLRRCFWASATHVYLLGCENFIRSCGLSLREGELGALLENERDKKIHGFTFISEQTYEITIEPAAHEILQHYRTCTKISIKRVFIYIVKKQHKLELKY